MAQNKKVLHAQEYIFVYETKFDRFVKTIKKFGHFIYLFLVLITLAITNFNPVITFLFALGYIVLLGMNNMMYEDKSKRPKIIGVHGTNKDYFFQVGTAVTSIEDIPSPQDVGKNWNKYVKKGILLYPVLIEDKMALTHMFVVGTTGAGKTTFLINILQQILMLGAGALAVDGKGDQTVYEAFYNTAVDCGREDDFLVINFNVPEESNTFNPLLKGNADEITDIIGNMLDTSGDNAFWSGRALTMMKALLSILIPLRDMDLLFDPKFKKQEILTLSLLVKWIDLQNLKTLYFLIKRSNDLGYLDIPGWPEDWKKRYQPIDIDRLESYLTSVYLDIHDEDADIQEGSSKQHGNSFLMWNEALDLLAGRFGPIFNTANPTIDMEDIVTNGRILYVLLPALKVDARSLSTIGKIILALFKNSVSVLLGEKISGTIEQRYQSFARRPRVPFWGVMDEYGAYAVEGFDNVLAQARSLKVSVAILVQEIASLKKTSETEAQRLLGNTGIKIALKVEEQKTAEEIVEFLGKAETATVRPRQEKTNEGERDIEVQEKEKIRVEQLKAMGPGHGYVMWAGAIQPILVRYYEPPIAPEIPEFDLFENVIAPNYVVKNKKDELINIETDDIEKEEDVKEISEELNKDFNKNIVIIDETIRQMDSIEIEENLKSLELAEKRSFDLAKEIEDKVKQFEEEASILERELFDFQEEEDFEKIKKEFDKIEKNLTSEELIESSNEEKEILEKYYQEYFEEE